MPRTRSTELILRDQEITRRRGEGESAWKLSQEFGVSIARISQIMLANHEEISDDAARAEGVAFLDSALEKVMETLHLPLQQKVAPNGKLVYGNLVDENGEIVRDSRGNPVQDPSKPVYDYSHVFEAAKQIPGLLDRKSKFMGLDRKAPRATDESAEYQAQLTWVQSVADASQKTQRENEELRARLAALERGGVEDAEIVSHDDSPSHHSLELLHESVEFTAPDPAGPGVDPDGR